ncbi:MAG: sigma-54 dependent transcriptional regulator [Candidatus Eisenbacteria bacterium]|uniref:Sigma-54 dependent transcriptional regulator n=1 Tax=Eiseniibacteriota bacterium TaxID=2212470 RepID=A0A948RVC7_UNCEI|nr:sigma-54 dependent transcriptional regulator [Candidatus Eisenbacteria bacterium]MBU2691206.1 sigma-54 dependent transcriptional regulator [Candidatus Eisenbacteria bacterium]
MSHVLIVEDNRTLGEAIRDVLKKGGLRTQFVETAEEAWEKAQDQWPDLVLTDLRLPGEDGLWLLDKLKGRNPTSSVLVLTAHGSVEKAVEAMKRGAFDFLTKPIRMDQLLLKVNQALDLSREYRLLLEEKSLLHEEVHARYNFGEIVGESDEMRRIYEQIRKVAPTSSSVLISGESGTGKEVVARAIHLNSQRKDRPFIRVNCGALAEGVLESELFGHERGAFTGAVRQRRGRFELAHDGSIFLDEISEIPPSIQVRLLRVLQEREFERVGGEETIKVNVRVMAATHRDLKKSVKEGKFREDLFYRLYVIPLHIPPLRERRGDIPSLCAHFLERLTKELGKKSLTMDPEALHLLNLYDWPGNVRELENVLERAAVLSEDERIRPRDLPFQDQKRSQLIPLPEGIPPLKEAVEEMEKQLIRRAVERAKGIKEEAARLLDLKPSTLYYKLEKYGLLEGTSEKE